MTSRSDAPQVRPIVVVAPHVLVTGRAPDGAQAWTALPHAELSRVPCAYEWLVLDGVTYRVLGVRHLVGGDVAAELQVERLQAAHVAESGSVSDDAA